MDEIINIFKNNLVIKDEFNLEKYYEKMDKIIKDIIIRSEKNNITYDILDTEKTKKNKLLALKEKQRLMKIGNIWQSAIGNYKDFIDLGTGHSSELDILSHTKKIAIELKNRTNTDNALSKKYNFLKLSKFKKNNPDYRCIYANINAKTKEKTLEGYNKKIIYNEVEIEHQVGYKFLSFIFEENTKEIIDFIKKTIDKYT